MELLTKINEYLSNIMRGSFLILRKFYSQIVKKRLLNNVKSINKSQNENNVDLDEKHEDETTKDRKRKRKEKSHKPPLTHFLSIPMNFKKVIDNVRQFKIDVLENIVDKDNAITEELFQKPERMHVTIGMLTLQDEEQLTKALDILQKCSSEIIGPYIQKTGLLKLELKGVESLNNNPEKTRVLYAKIIDETASVQELCNNIMHYFIENGIMEKEHNSLKLHITLMNSTFRGRKKSPSGKRYPRNFDATKIIEMYKDTVFGETMFNTIHLSQRYKYTEDGYYFPLAKIQFEDLMTSAAEKTDEKDNS